MKIKPQKSEKLPLVPPGISQGVVAQLLDFGSHWEKNKKTGKDELKRKLRIIWELPYETFTSEGEEKRRNIGRTYNVSFNERSALRPVIEALRNKPMTKAEADGELDTDCLAGLNGQINVIHLNGDKGPYAWVDKVVPLAKGMSPVALAGKPLIFNLPADDGPIELPDWMPDYFKDKVKASEEWKTKYGVPDTTGIGSEEE